MRKSPASAVATFLRRLEPIGVVGAAANSVYLTAVFTRAFFSEENIALLAKDFSIPFYTAPIILMSLLLISNIRSKTYLPEKKHPWIFIFLTVPFYFMLVLFIGAFAALLWTQIAVTAASSLRIAVSLVAEVVAITAAVGAQKWKRLGRVIGLIVGWAFSVMGAFTVLGIFKKQHAILISDEMRLVFTGIFFHAANSIYIIHAGLRAYKRRKA